MNHDHNHETKPSWLVGDKKRKADEIAHHFSKIMEVLELDLTDPHLEDTPARVGRMYLEIFRGLEKEADPKITVFPNDENYSNMVVVSDINYFSVCSHHMIPFFGKAHVAYIPNEKIIGLSKIARIVEFFARRPQLQERLTEQIVDYMDEKLEPKGAMAVLQGRHFCMEMRGVEKIGAETSTSAIRGCFEEQRVRDECFELIRK